MSPALLNAKRILHVPIETTDSQALILITGAVKTTPITDMLSVTKSRTIKEMLEEKLFSSVTN